MQMQSAYNVRQSIRAHPRSKAMKIELTDEQERAVKQGQAVEIVDPGTLRAYLLIAREAYERGQTLLKQPAPAASPEEAVGIPPGIRRSQEAYWRDLPQLLAQKKMRGWW